MVSHLDLKKCFPIYHVSQKLGGPSLRLGDTQECLNIPSGIGWGGNDTGRLVMCLFPLRTDSASWKSLESFIQFTSFCNSCTLPENFKIVFWSSISFLLAIVSKVELWNFHNSSISVRLWRWASRNSYFCCHSCPCRSRRSSSARAAWSSWWLTFSRYSAMIVSLWSSSRVLFCAFELLRSSGCPDRSTISHQVALIYRTFQTTTTDWLTRLLVRSNRLALGTLLWASCRVSGHPCPGPRQGSWRRGRPMSSGARRSHGPWDHNLCGGRGSRRCPHTLG